MKCKKCDCDIEDLTHITALEIEMIDFWGCEDCKKKYVKEFKKQQSTEEPLPKNKKLF